MEDSISEQGTAMRQELRKRHLSGPGRMPGSTFNVISHHRQSRWYEEGPLKGPSDEAQFTLVPIRTEALSLTVGPPAPVVPSSRSPEAPPHGGSTRSIRRVSPPVPRCLPRSGAVSNHAGNGRACRSLTARGGGFHKIEKRPLRKAGGGLEGLHGRRNLLQAIVFDRLAR